MSPLQHLDSRSGQSSKPPQSHLISTSNNERINSIETNLKANVESLEGKKSFIDDFNSPQDALTAIFTAGSPFIEAAAIINRASSDIVASIGSWVYKFGEPVLNITGSKSSSVSSTLNANANHGSSTSLEVHSSNNGGNPQLKSSSLSSPLEKSISQNTALSSSQSLVSGNDISVSTSNLNNNRTLRPQSPTSPSDKISYNDVTTQSQASNVSNMNNSNSSFTVPDLPQSQSQRNNQTQSPSKNSSSYVQNDDPVNSGYSSQITHKQQLQSSGTSIDSLTTEMAIEIASIFRDAQKLSPHHEVTSSINTESLINNHTNAKHLIEKMTADNSIIPCYGDIERIVISIPITIKSDIVKEYQLVIVADDANIYVTKRNQPI